MKFWKKQKICGPKQNNNPMLSLRFLAKQTLFYSAIAIATYLFCLAALPDASALTMSNSDYIIEMGNLNSFAGNKSGSGYKLVDTGGQLAPGLFSGTNYTIRSGFEYIKSVIPFIFQISSLEISFGTIDPTSPVTRNNFLIVSNGSAAGYQVTAQENHALLEPALGKTIPNTTCDNGLCTDTTSDVWTSTLTYGFGYRCDNISGTDCQTGFTGSTNYKQFSASPSAAIVMTGANVGRNKKVQITYKVNVSQSQAAGTYTNQIQYIATPTF